MTFPGPAALGRGLVISAGGAVPEPWAGSQRISVTDDVVGHPAPTVAALHDAWLRRQPVVIELAADPAVIRNPGVEKQEPWELDPSFEFPLDRLQFLLWANNYDARTGEPIWWWSRKAVRAFGAAAVEAGPADITVDGAPMWCDGGPRHPVEAAALDGHCLLHRDSVELGRLTPARFQSPVSALAPDQYEAVDHRVGPARIIAPAGSGKTRVLTERLRHLIADRGWEPDSICALAYNKRAADEMVERTSGLGAHIRTLNSLGLAICNGTGGFAVPAGRPRRTVIEEVEIRQTLERLVDVKHAPNTDPYVPYLEGMRAIRLALMPPDEAELTYDAPGLADAFGRYCEILDDKGFVDFDGQLYEAIRILLQDPAARARAQSVGRHLLVDEFQDLTPAHLLLLRLMAAPTYDVFGVGDDDQVIYGFGGATPEYLLHFEKYFPGAAHHALEVNYRCPPSVVEAATKLLSYNDERIAKHVRPKSDRPAMKNELSVRRVPDIEAAPVSVALLDEWHSDGSAYDDMAVLTRVNSTLLPVQIMLTQAGVPCRAPLTEAILDRTGTRTALAYLRIGLDPASISRKDLTETIRRPGRRIARNVVEMLTKRSTTSVAEIRRLSDHLSGSDSRKLLDFAGDLDRVVKTVQEGDAAAALRVIRVHVGLGEAMDVLDGSRREADRSTHSDDLAALEQVAVLHPEVATFESWLRSALRNRPSAGGVELSTIHRVKGREWERVVVYGVDEGLLPHRLADDESEERRLLHVAITRCRDRCVIVSNVEQPSDFLGELDGSRPREVKKEKAAAQAGPSVSKQLQVAAEPGLVVRLTAGYEGEIVELKRDSALVAVDGARMTVRYGEVVRIGNKAVVLGLPVAEAPADPQRQALVEAVRKWRTEVASRESVPAYVILSNADVDNIAAAAPRNLKDLAKCRGMGPVRLERYGDEILSVIDSTLEPA